MLTNCFGAISRYRVAILLVALSLGGSVRAQQVSLALLRPPSSSIEGAPIVAAVQPATLPEAASHRFWDRENSVLFATSAAFSTADFFITRANLKNGGQELNPMTSVFGRSSAGLAMNFAGENIGLIGISYMFHKTGHHKIERFVSMLNISASAAAVSFDLARR